MSDSEHSPFPEPASRFEELRADLATRRPPFSPKQIKVLHILCTSRDAIMSATVLGENVGLAPRSVSHFLGAELRERSFVERLAECGWIISHRGRGNYEVERVESLGVEVFNQRLQVALENFSPPSRVICPEDTPDERRAVFTRRYGQSNTRLPNLICRETTLGLMNELRADIASLGPFPNHSTCVLLLILLERKGAWINQKSFEELSEHGRGVFLKASRVIDAMPSSLFSRHGLKFESKGLNTRGAKKQCRLLDL